MIPLDISTETSFCSELQRFKILFQKSDVISRWGGDNLVLFSHTTKEKGIEIIKRIKRECQRKSTLTIPLNISFGIATKENITRKH